MPTYYHYKPLQILSVSFSEDFEKAVQKLRRDFQARQTPLIEQRDQAPWDQLETLQIFWENVGTILLRISMNTGWTNHKKGAG